MGSFWGRQDPGGPHFGPMNFAMWDIVSTLETDDFATQRASASKHCIHLVLAYSCASTKHVNSYLYNLWWRIPLHLELCYQAQYDTPLQLKRAIWCIQEIIGWQNYITEW